MYYTKQTSPQPQGNLEIVRLNDVICLPMNKSYYLHFAKRNSTVKLLLGLSYFLTRDNINICSVNQINICGNNHFTENTLDN